MRDLEMRNRRCSGNNDNDSGLAMLDVADVKTAVMLIRQENLSNLFERDVHLVYSFVAFSVS